MLCEKSESANSAVIFAFFGSNSLQWSVPFQCNCLSRLDASFGKEAKEANFVYISISI